MKRLTAMAVTAVLLNMLLCACGLAKIQENKSESVINIVKTDGNDGKDNEKNGANNKKMCGMWVATVSNIDFPSDTGLGEDKLKSEIDNIVNDASEYGVNAIFLQVRPKSDAIYKSDIFPSSSVVVEKQGDRLPFDILSYFIEAAHKNNIELHAWINPYRINNSSSSEKGHDLSLLAYNNPARLHQDWVVKHKFESGGKTMYAMYYNPGLPQVRNLILDGIIELVENYDIDGVHMDDYFYPYDNASGFDDSEAYEKYGGSLDIGDWRRSNNDKLVEEIHNYISACGKNISFGISPCGVWAKKTSSMPEGTEGIGNTIQAYYDIYADTRKWVINKWVDYICPQVYWQIDHSKAPFKPIVDWWDDLCGTAEAALYIGIGCLLYTSRCV